jgi:AcrR family transcriptional regulator
VSPRPQIDHIRRPQLLEAAAAVIAERGFAATRIADVAERAGTSAPGVLYWFDSREQLLAEALTYAEEAYYEQLAGELRQVEGAPARLATLIESSVGGEDWVLWIELWTRALRDDDLAQSRQSLDDHWREQIAGIVREGQASGDFAGDDPERVAVELAALMDGLAVQVALGDSMVTPERMRAICVEVTERLLEVSLPELSEAAA